MDKMVITPEEIKQLAILGSTFCESELAEKNLIHWIGHLPNQRQIEKFFAELAKIQPYFVVED